MTDTTYLVAGLALLGGAWAAYYYFFKSGLEYVDGAYWIGGYRRWRLFNRFKKGVVIDGRRHLSEQNSFKHVLIAAPTGGGKTTRFILPNLLSASGASYIVTDPDGSVFDRSAGYLKSTGYRVCKIDVADPGASLAYNPLYRVTSHTDANKISAVLVDAAYPGGSGDSAFWNDSAKALLTMLIATLLRCDDEFRHLGSLKRLLNEMGHDGSGLDEWMAVNADAATFSDYKGFRSASTKVAQSIVTTAQTSLAMFSDPDLCRLTATETLHFETMRTEPTAIFFCFPEVEARYYAFLGALLFTQVFAFCMQTPKKDALSIFALMDEGGNSAKIPNFSTIITAIRKRRVSITLVLQDKAQLDRIYGRDDAHVIINGGCSNRIFLPGLSHEMCRSVSDALGKTTVIDRRNNQERRVVMPLLEPDEVRMLPDNKAIFVSGNQRPAIIRMKPYYKIRKLRKRSKIEAPAQVAIETSDVQFIQIDLVKMDEEEPQSSAPIATRNGIEAPS